MLAPGVPEKIVTNPVFGPPTKYPRLNRGTNCASPHQHLHTKNSTTDQVVFDSTPRINPSASAWPLLPQATPAVSHSTIMASSAASGLLGRQLKQMQSDKDMPGISCGLVENNVLEWEVMLMISDDCKYYGGMISFAPNIIYTERQC